MRNKLASSIAILLNYGAQWRLLYYIFYVLCLDFELSVILDNQVDWYSNPTHLEVSWSGQISSEERCYGNRCNLLLLLLDWVDPSYLLWKMDLWLILVLLIIFTTIIGFYLSCVFRLVRCQDLASSGLLRNFVLRMVVTSKYWMIGCLFFAFKSFTCIEIKKEGSIKSVTAISLSTECSSYPAFVLYFVCVVLCLVAVAGFYYSQFFKSLIPTPKLCSTRGFWSEIVEVGFTLSLLLANCLLVSIHMGRESKNQTYYIISLVISTIMLLYYALAPTYHEKKFNSLNMFKGYLYILLLVWLRLARESDTTVQITFYTVHIIGLLCFSLVLKLHIVFGNQYSPSLLLRDWNANSQTEIILLCNRYLEEILVTEDPENVKRQFGLELVSFYTAHTKMITGNTDLYRQFERVLKVVLDQPSSALFPEKPTNEVAESSQFMLTYKQFYPSISGVSDTFFDQIGRQTKEIIGLLDILFANIDPKLLLLDQKRNFKVVLLQIIHNLNYNGKCCAAIYHLKSVEKMALTGQKHRFALTILRQYLSLRLAENLSSNSLLAAWMQPLNNQLIGTTKQSPSLRQIVGYSNCLAKITADICKMLQRRGLFLEEISKGRLTSGQVFVEAKHWLKTSKQLEKDLGSLQESVNDKSLVLQLHKAFFLIHLSHRLKEGFSLIRSLVKKKFISYTRPQSREAAQEAEFDMRNIDGITVVGASTDPKQFHQITYASANIFDTLGFEAEKLVGRDLSVLIPEPIGSKHAEFFSSSGSTGRIFSLKHEEDILVLDSHGHFKNIGLMVRINPLLDSSTLYFAKVNFVGRQDERNELLLNKSLKIMAVNRKSAQHFTRGSYLHQYQQQFQQIFLDFLKVSVLRKDNPSLELGYFAERRQEIHEFKKYYGLRVGKEISIVSHKGQLENIKFNLIDIYIRAIDQPIILMQYEVQNHEVYTSVFKNCVMPSRKKKLEQATVHNDEQDREKTKLEVRAYATSLSNHDRSLLNFIEYLEEVGYLAKDTQTPLAAANSITKDSVKSLGGKETMSPAHRTPHALSSRTVASQYLISRTIRPVTEVVPGSSDCLKFERLIALVNNKLLAKAFRDISRSSQPLLRHSLRRHTNSKQNLDFHVSEWLKNSTCQASNHHIHLSETVFFSKQKLTFKLGLKNLILISLLVFFVELLLSTLKYRQTRSQLDSLTDQLELLMLNSKAVFYPTIFAAYIDLVSAVKSDIIPDNVFSDLLPGSSILKSYSSAIQRYTDYPLRDVIKSEYLRGKIWGRSRDSEAKFEVRRLEDFLTNTSSLSSDFRFVKSQIMESEFAFRYLQPEVNKLYNTNVLESAVLSQNGYEPTRFMYVKYNLQNGVLAYLTKQSASIEAKINQTSKSSVDWMVNCLVAVGILSSCLIGLWMAYLLFMRKVMREWIEINFNLKVVAPHADT